MTDIYLDFQQQVQRCGIIVDDYQTEVDGHYFRQKIYKFQGKMYLETWWNGTTPLFIELSK